MAELFATTGPTAAEIKAAQVAEIAAAMVEGMNVANARQAQAAALLNGGMPEVQQSATITNGSDGAA
jgi:hypothetical protein